MNKQRNWFLIITPCRLAMLFAVFAFIYAIADLHSSGGWSGILIFPFATLLAITGLIDLLLATFIKKKAGLLWLIEIVVVAAAIVWIFRLNFGV